MYNNYFCASECCPHCDNENEYPMFDVFKNGYVVKCNHCGKEIFLCDECRHAEDNPNMRCDWRKTNIGGQCFRGITVNTI